MAELITPSIFHRTLDSVELIAQREIRGLSQCQFAKHCGWSQQMQSNFEAPGLHEVHISYVKSIRQILRKIKPKR